MEVSASSTDRVERRPHLDHLLTSSFPRSQLSEQVIDLSQNIPPIPSILTLPTSEGLFLGIGGAYGAAHSAPTRVVGECLLKFLPVPADGGPLGLLLG